jgi:transposase-like protein
MAEGNRRYSDRRGFSERRVTDRRTAEHAVTATEAATCPKCGSRRTVLTAGVSSGSDHFGVFRCGVCFSRFVRGGLFASRGPESVDLDQGFHRQPLL